MKKALALVLALVLALSMAVSAFAATVELVTLKPATATVAGLKPVYTLNLDAKNVDYRVAGAAGVYYVLLADKDYKNVEVTADGVTAKVVEYDPTVYEYVEEIPYYVYDRVNGVAVDLAANRVKMEDATKTFYEDGVSMKSVYTFDAYGSLVLRTWEVGGADKMVGVAGQYAHMLAIATALNKAEKTTQYVVKTDANTTLVEITVPANYTAAYAEGQVKISATLDKKAVSAKLTLIRDVTIWDYETVKWAATYGKELDVASDKGYSDYLTYLAGYDKADLTSVSVKEAPVVVSTTAFRAIEGKDLVVNNAGMEVAIEEIAAGQKGVNFSAYGVTPVDVNGVPVAVSKKATDAIVFGFYGKQVVKSDFTITLDTGYTYFTLREEFGVKVEEDDVITYYLLKDGKVIKPIEVDYMTIDPTDLVEIEINASNTTLGEYEIRLDVTTTAEGAEENPNTGAESVVGVVAALAVVSVATAAAVSLKK